MSESRAGARSPFDALVDAYDAARPSYPDAVFDAIDGAVPLDGADVVEIGAGTGIATRALRSRGARVVPVDIGIEMLRRLRQHTPDQPVVIGSGEALPIRGGAADAVCCAQAWHWLDDAVASREVVRVLRPGGLLAVWWNDVAAAGERWYDDQQRRLQEMNPHYAATYRDRPEPEPLSTLGLFDRVDIRRFRWSRRITLEDYETWLRSKSYVAALGVREAEFLAAERASLAAAFPDGVVDEPFEVHLVLAWAPR